MSFDKVQIKRRNSVSWINIFGQPRSMSNWRLLGTAASWILGIAAIYCSLFYLPAFYDYRKAFGISSATPQINVTERNMLSPYMDLLKQNKTFLRSGQAMEASYKIESSARGKLLFFKCQSPLVIEVFKCDPVIVKEFPLNKSSGKFAIQVNQNDFYGFTLALNDSEAKYAVAWRRFF